MKKIKDLILKNRSYRRFKQEAAVSRKALLELVDLARLSASAANMQPLKYVLSYESKKNALIFSCLTWAGYLTKWPGPREGEKPAAYIIVLGDKKINGFFQYDCGIAAQSILLGATEKGLGGCMLGSIDREKLKKNMRIPEKYEILLVLAIGKPKETVLITGVSQSGGIKYYRDKRGKHYVPKRKLKDLIL